MAVQQSTDPFGGLLNLITTISKGSTVNNAQQNQATVAGTQPNLPAPMSPMDGVVHLINVLGGTQPTQAQGQTAPKAEGAAGGAEGAQTQSQAGGKNGGKSPIEGLLRLISLFG